MLVRLQPQPLSLPYREKLVMLYWYILTPLHLLLYMYLWPDLQATTTTLLLASTSWRFRRRTMSTTTLRSRFLQLGFHRSAGWAPSSFGEPLGHLDFVCTRTCLSSAVMRWCNDEPCGFCLLLYFTFGPLYAWEILCISCHVLLPVVQNPVARRLPCFAYRWYVMCFYLRNWCESANLEIVPHIGPYNLVSEQDWL